MAEPSSNDPKTAARVMREFGGYIQRHIDSDLGGKFSKRDLQRLHEIAAKTFDTSARRVRRSTGRRRGHQPDATDIKEDDFRRDFADYMTRFPLHRIRDVAAYIHVDPKTVERYLRRWQIAKPPHWRKRKASSAR